MSCDGPLEIVDGRCRLGDWAVHAGHDDERPVEPGTEPLRQQVVRLPGGQGGWVVARVGEGQPHAEEREGERHEHERSQGAGEPRPPLHEAAPAVPEPVLGWRPTVWRRRGRCHLSMALPAKPEHGGQQGQGGNEHHEHGRDAGSGQADHVRLADEVEAEERDDHRAAGEEDRTARRHEGRDDRVARDRGPRRCLAGSG